MAREWEANEIEQLIQNQEAGKPYGERPPHQKQMGRDTLDPTIGAITTDDPTIPRFEDPSYFDFITEGFPGSGKFDSFRSPTSGERYSGVEYMEAEFYKGLRDVYAPKIANLTAEGIPKMGTRARSDLDLLWNPSNPLASQHMIPPTGGASGVPGLEFPLGLDMPSTIAGFKSALEAKIPKEGEPVYDFSLNQEQVDVIMGNITEAGQYTMDTHMEGQGFTKGGGPDESTIINELIKLDEVDF
tara:strand:- start:588 stop:1316 length:729 start_codon:yes stop_codon:yes gene_type:complete